MQKTRNPSEKPFAQKLYHKFLCLIILFIFCLLPYHAHTQELSLEVATGASMGWWYYTQGKLDDAFDKEKGNAYTESTLMLPLETNIRYTIKRFDAGLGMQYAFFVEDEMFSVGNQDANLNSFAISKNAVTFFKAHLLASYAVVRANKYTLSPQVKAGIFSINTIHPDKDKFGHKTFWEAGVRNEVAFSKWRLVFYPCFNTMTIQQHEPAHEKAHHKIYSLGIMFGVVWPLYKK